MQSQDSEVKDCDSQITDIENHPDAINIAIVLEISQDTYYDDSEKKIRNDLIKQAAIISA